MRSIIFFSFFLCMTCSKVLAEELGPPDVYASVLRSLPETGNASTQTTLLQEALPLDEWQIVGDPAAEAKLAKLLDYSSQEPTWLSRWQAAGLLTGYSGFLQTAEWGRLPFNAQEKAEFDELLEKLFSKSGETYVPKPPYQTFLDLKRTYDRTLADWQATPSESRTPELERRLNTARAQFENYTKSGDGTSIRLADRRLRSLRGYDYVSFGQRAQSVFKANSALPSDISPPLRTVASAKSNWIVVEVNLSSLKEIKFGYDPTSVARYWCCDAELRSDDPAIIRLHFELAYVNISRPWMDEDVAFGVARQLWRYPENMSSATLSSGAPASSDNWLGQLTYIPRSYLVVRNLQLSIPDDPRIYRAIRRAIAGNAKLRIGPFAVAGTFQTDLGPVEVIPHLSGSDLLVVPTLQIIGSSGSLMPIAPQPRSDLVWQSQLPKLPID